MIALTRCNPHHPGTPLLLLFAILLLVVPGCSSDDNKPRSSENSKFSGSTDGQEQSNTDSEVVEALSGPIEVPDGDATAMLAFIDKTMNPGPTNPQDALIMATAILEATDRILDDKQATEQQRRRAAEIKLVILSQLQEMKAPGIQQMVLEFSKTMSIDSDEQLAQQGKQMLFMFSIQAVMTGEDKDYEGFKKKVLAWISELGGDSPDIFNLVYRSALALQAVDREEEAAEIFQQLGTTFKDSSNPELAAEAINILQLAEVFRADLDIKMEDMSLKGVSAYGPIKESVTYLLAMENPGGMIFDRVRGVAEILERGNFTEQATEIYQAIETTFRDHPDEEIREAVDDLITRSIVRIGLIGKAVEVEGINTSDGSRIDWSHFQDRVVLLSFWASWDLPSLHTLPELLQQYNQYHEKGFEVIGVNIDDNPQLFDAFTKEGIKEVLEVDAFPWITITTTDPDQRGFDTPLAITCGISSIPSTVLFGRDGRIVATNVGGDSLKQLLIKLLDEPASETDSSPAEENNSSLEIKKLFSSLAALRALSNPWSTSLLLIDEEETADSEDNPYLAPAGLSALDLVDYLLDMLEKPRSIRRRPGFAEAVSEAADRLLAAETSDRYHVIAVESKVQVLHELASLGNKRADGMLVLLMEKLKDDKRPRIAAQVHFLKIEQEMLKIDELPLEQVPGKLDAMQQYLAAEKLLGRHLRIASATVHGINRLEDPEQKEKYFQAFGKIFTTSTDKTLASYGKKIASSPSSSPSDLVGKPLALEGETELGVALDWKSYRGKVVLLDFWATWCGPCLREMPNVRAIHKRLEKQGFTVLAINLDRKPEDLEKFLEENEFPWTNLIAEGAREAATRYGVRAIPTMMVIDQQGNVAAVAHRVAEVSGTIEKLLKKPEQK